VKGTAVVDIVGAATTYKECIVKVIATVGREEEHAAVVLEHAQEHYG